MLWENRLLKLLIFIVTLSSISCGNWSRVDDQFTTQNIPVIATTLTIDDPAQWATLTYLNTADVVFTVTNPSTTTEATAVVPTTSSPYSIQSTTCGTTLAKGATCTITVRFTSPGCVNGGCPQVFTTTLNIAYNNGLIATSLSKILSATSNVATVTVTEVYDTAVDGFGKAKWNDYVRASSTSTPCDATEPGYYASCIHSGENLKVSLSGTTSCSGLTLTEALGVFTWTCSDASGTAVFSTTGFQTNKGLAHLLNATTWKDNSITISNGSLNIYASTSTTWHSNTVSALADNSGTCTAGSDSGVTQFGATSQIYTLSASRTARGYIFNADKVALVVLPGATLSYNDCATSNVTGSGTQGTNFKALVGGGGKKFIWLEGRLSGSSGSNDPSYVFIGASTLFSRFHRITIVGDPTATQEGMRFNTGSNQNYLSDINISNISSSSAGTFFVAATYNTVKNYKTHSAGYGVAFTSNANYNKLSELRISNVGVHGITIAGTSNYNIIHDLTVYGAGTFGVSLSDSTNNILTKLTLVNTQNSAITVHGTATNNTIGFITAVNSSGSGFSIQNSAASNTVFSLNSINNAGYGFGLRNTSSSNLISNISLTKNAAGVGFTDTTTANVFTDNIIVGDNSNNCVNGSGGTNPGLANTTCANQGSSNAVTRILSSIGSSLVGTVSSDSNTSDTNGIADYSVITDWLTFDNIYRGWGKHDASNAWQHANYRGRCTTGNCRIFDARYSSADTVSLNKSFDGNAANGTFTGGALCPNAVDADFALTDLQSTPKTFMVNAMEIIGDGVGNDNGLCEAGDNCIYQPNFGAYMGEGDYTTLECSPDAVGTVIPNKIYKYPTNGG